MSGDRLDFLARIQELEQENKRLKQRDKTVIPKEQYVIDGTYYVCECGHLLIERFIVKAVGGSQVLKSIRYCSECGRPILWEGTKNE
jgi:hypothetical protein